MTGRWRAAALLQFVGLPAVLLGVHAASLDNAFQYDDVHSLVENPHVRSLEQLGAFFHRPELFSADPKSAMYRPLVLVSYAVNHFLGGYQVGGYHWVNLLLHIGNALLVCQIVQKSTGQFSSGLGAGFIFGLHPVNSEVVNYISSRSESLCALFFLLGFLAYVHSREAADTGKSWRTLSLLSFALSLLAKSVGIMLLAILLLREILPDKPENRRTWRAIFARQWPFWAVGGMYLLVVERFIRTALVQAPVRSLGAQLCTQLKALVYYAKLLFFPHGLNVEHQFILADSLGQPAVLASLALMVSAVLVLCLGGGRQGGVLFWSAWPLLVLLPTLVIPLNVLVNEHRLYIPGMAFALGVATLLGAFIQRRGKVGLAFSLLGLGIFCALDAQRTRVWASEETLWQDALRKSPLMPRPHLYMGHVLQEAGMREQALREYQQALTVYPEILSGGDVLSIYNNMGAAYLAMGRNREAIAAYGRALQIDSTYARARQSLEALLALQQTERQSQANALHQKGLLLMIGGQVEQAVEAFRNSLDIQPWEETYMALAQAHERLEDWEQASQAYAELLALSPQGAFAQRARQRLEELRGK